MKKRMAMTLAALALSVIMAVPAYAGTWKYVNDQWKYQRGANKFAYNEWVKDNGNWYYLDKDGYMKTGKIANVEEEDDNYTYYFETKNGKNGLGYNGLKDDYLYFNGKRLDADDDYRLYYYDGDIYLTNTKGKVQKTSKKYDIENKGIAEDDVKVEISGKKVVSVALASGKTIKAEDLIADAEAQFGKDVVTEDQIVSVPFIQLYDDDIYTYTNLAGTKAVEGWLGLNK